MTDDHLSRLEMRRRQLLEKMRSNTKLLNDISSAMEWRLVERNADLKELSALDAAFAPVYSKQQRQIERAFTTDVRTPVDHPYDLSRGEKADILWAWADGQLRTTEACTKLDCTPAELLDTAALHEVDFPAGLKLPTYTLREDGPWTTVELLIANGFELVVTGAEDVDWPSDDPDVVDAALRGQDQAVVIIVDNTIPAEGWENVGWIHYRDEGKGLVPVDALGGLASVRRILDLPEPEPRYNPPLTEYDLSWPPMSVHDHLVAWHLGRMSDEEVSAALELDEDDDLHEIARDNGIEPPATPFKP